MRIGIIGAGFTGLTAAYKLAKSGHQVTLLEKESLPGGLAIGFRENYWEWPLEKHYHHIFTSDNSIINLATEINHPVFFHRPKTSTLISDQIFQLDSPITLLKFPKLPLIDRIRTGLVLGFLRFTPFWQPLEKVTAESFLKLTMGINSWRLLWHPLFFGKFGDYYSKISAAWFWARIKKRSSSLGYFSGGFQSLAQTLSDKCEKLGVKIYFRTGVTNISPSLSVTTDSGKSFQFDRVICTLPSPLFTKVTPSLPSEYVSSLSNLAGIGAVNMVLSLKKQFFSDSTYWLNINNRDLPFLAVVEHTNFIDSSHYGGDHLLYIGNYLPATHRYFNLSPQQMIKIYLPYLKLLNPRFNKSWIKNSYLWKAPFAQPIVDLNYSQKIPSLQTPIKNLFLANIQQVYPWDRGTNYAVELGEKVARLCEKESNLF